MRYLTRSYVEWLGLAPYAAVSPNATAGWVSHHAAKPMALHSFDLCVDHGGHTYVRSHDGLSWDRS